MGSASPVQVVLIIFLLCIISFAFGWMFRDMKGSRVRRFKLKRSYIRKIRYNRRLIKLSDLSRKYDWKGNIY
jgi:hypothetical protein